MRGMHKDLSAAAVDAQHSDHLAVLLEKVLFIAYLLLTARIQMFVGCYDASIGFSIEEGVKRL